MRKICVMILEHGNTLFRFFKEMELSRVPMAGEMIFIEDKNSEKTTTYVYKVVVVHFADCGKTDVLVVNVGKQEDYLRNLGSTITAK